jgi:hypothetical protein
VQAVQQAASEAVDAVMATDPRAVVTDALTGGSNLTGERDHRAVVKYLAATALQLGAIGGGLGIEGGGERRCVCGGGAMVSEEGPGP